MTVREKNQQDFQLLPEIKACVANLNARIANANLAIADLTREIDNTFKTLITMIAELQKENGKAMDKAPESCPS